MVSNFGTYQTVFIGPVLNRYVEKGFSPELVW